MALVAWKAGLPTCAQAWNEQDAPNVIRTSVEVGPPKVRRRSTLLLRTINVSWTMNSNIYELFTEFYETDCQQGINEFEYKHPITGLMNRYRFAEPPKIDFIQGSKGVGAISVSCVWELQL